MKGHFITKIMTQQGSLAIYTQFALSYKIFIADLKLVEVLTYSRRVLSLKPDKRYT